jgi:uncharacterized repeat protein (TIGR04076 family)
MFKVRCRLVSFDGDEEMFPCHFNYKIGDEFYYDGVNFTGRICPGLLASMMPIIYGVHSLGHRYSGNIMFKYRGLDSRDPSKARYDGAGFSPRKRLPEGAPELLVKLYPSIPKTQKVKFMRFSCSDTRTLAQFICEAVDLSDSDYCQPFYRRGIAILEKIEAEPGIKTDGILDRFTEFERDEISPPLTPVFLEVMLEALLDMNYIEIHDKRAYATGKEPPSRPKIG